MGHDRAASRLDNKRSGLADQPQPPWATISGNPEGGGLWNRGQNAGILAHNKATGAKCESLLDKCIYAGDPITGFINAIALVYPDKNVNSVKVKSILAMKETRCSRELTETPWLLSES